MANAEYTFTNKNEDIRGRITEVNEFAKSRGIFIKQMEVFHDPDALKDADTTHEVFDIPDECEEGGCTYTPDDTPLPEEETYESLRELFAKVFGFDE